MNKSLSMWLIGVFVAFTCLPVKALSDDESTQTLRGRITDSQSKFQLIGANVVIQSNDPNASILGSTTDLEGYFEIKNIPVGRKTVVITYLGYKKRVIDNVLLLVGKETVLNVELEEEVIVGQEIVIRADKTEPLNELTMVSSRQFSIEETQRYAGSRSDPARMAANFAGVSGANDGRNDIIIRGNSPTGVLWRLDGLPIANPNHFGALGSTGGPVSMLNNNLLSNSDFLTGAFAAEYGNAIAGVFDLQMRNGNSEKREYLGQIGFNGFEFGAEGPFSKNSRASYLVNYRYSTLGLMSNLGFDFGTGAAIPQYQDLSFKINVPTKKAGIFSLYGIGGVSDIAFLDSEADTTQEQGTDLYGQDGFDNTSDFGLGILGFNHRYFIDKNTYTKFGISFNGSWTNFEQDSLGFLVIDGDTTRRLDQENITNVFKGRDRENRVTFHLGLNKKVDARNTFNTGAYLHHIDFAYRSDTWNPISETRVQQSDLSGSTQILETYAQWLHKFNNRLSINAGLHYQRFFYNGDQAVEPRFGVKYELKNGDKFNFGYGLHAQALPLSVYTTITHLESGLSTLTNSDLGFVRSHHFVLGYETSFAKNWRLKAETYYQSIFDAAVESSPSAVSMLNFGADFGLPSVDSLVNRGTGYNYGVELTIERFLSKGFYTLVTGSFFNSRYEGSDGIERNTAFNGNYVLNTLAGKEFNLSKNRTLVIDLKVTYAGGRRFTPIDLEESRRQGRTSVIEELAFSERLDNYFRADAKVMFRKQGKKVTQEWGVDIQNITNRENIFSRDYSRTEDAITTIPQIGFFPVPQYRILF